MARFDNIKNCIDQEGLFPQIFIILYIFTSSMLVEYICCLALYRDAWFNWTNLSLHMHSFSISFQNTSATVSFMN